MKPIDDSLTAEVMSEILTEARGWVADCTWADDTSALTDQQIRAGINRHYDGGWAGFIADGMFA